MSDTENKITSVITYLEMTQQPTSPQPPAPAKKIAMLRAENPTVSFYRYLYHTVGEEWLWYERRQMDDETLKSIIQDKKVEIFVFYVGGVPAGYAELDRRIRHEVEIAYFGLMPEFLGTGIGKYFLRWAIDQAWSYHPKRIWVHTCTEDHPNALPTYQRCGFSVYQRETIEIDNPATGGLFNTVTNP